MTRQIDLRSSLGNRRQSVLTNQSPARNSGNVRFAEVAGGTAADCTAICCCCPCGLMTFLVLAMYKLPAGLCRKMLKKKRFERLKKAGLLVQRPRCTCGCDETEVQIHPASGYMLTVDDKSTESDESEEDMVLMELEKEMWDQFYNTGFWRSPSRSGH